MAAHRNRFVDTTGDKCRGGKTAEYDHEYEHEYEYDYEHDYEYDYDNHQLLTPNYQLPP